MTQVQTLRRHTGWLQRAVVTGRAESTTTHLALDEEYWLALRHPAEVERVGRSLLAAGDAGFGERSEFEQNQIWREFRAYVRQAEGFYRGALVLPWKSSPLNFYYFAMNLAKAAALAKGVLPFQPQNEPRRLQHGLSARVQAGAPDTWRLIVTGSGVFSRLYRTSIGVDIPDQTELDGRRLLGYLAGIGWQLEKSGNEGLKAWFPCKWVVAVASAEYWDVIAAPRSMPIERLPASLGEAYCEVSPQAAKQFAFDTMGLHATQASGYRFLERRIPLATNGDGSLQGPELDRRLRAALPNCVFECPTDADHHFAIGLPYVSATGGNEPARGCLRSHVLPQFLGAISPGLSGRYR
jgi:hypothetical protein